MLHCSTVKAHQAKGSISALVHVWSHCKNWHKGTFLQVCAENKSGGMSRDQYRQGKAKCCIYLETHPWVLYLPISIHISTGGALNSILYFELLLSWYCISLSDCRWVFFERYTTPNNEHHIYKNPAKSHSHYK